MQTNIVVKFQVEGVHNWPEASKFEPTMKYLEHPHRHMSVSYTHLTLPTNREE